MNLESCNLAKLQTWARWNVKADGWIKPDLSISSSSWFSRVFWSIVGKHFACIRKLYGIDLQLSRENLLKYRKIILMNSNENEIMLFNRFVRRFNEFFPKYTVEGLEEKVMSEIFNGKIDRERAFIIFENKVERLKNNCKLLERRYSKLLESENSIFSKIKMLWQNSFSKDDFELLNQIEEDFDSIKNIKNYFYNNEKMIFESDEHLYQSKIKGLWASFGGNPSALNIVNNRFEFNNEINSLENFRNLSLLLFQLKSKVIDLKQVHNEVTNLCLEKIEAMKVGRYLYQENSFSLCQKQRNLNQRVGYLIRKIFARVSLEIYDTPLNEPKPIYCNLKESMQKLRPEIVEISLKIYESITSKEDLEKLELLYLKSMDDKLLFLRRYFSSNNISNNEKVKEFVNLYVSIVDYLEYLCSIDLSNQNVIEDNFL